MPIMTTNVEPAASAAQATVPWVVVATELATPVGLLELIAGDDGLRAVRWAVANGSESETAGCMRWPAALRLTAAGEHPVLAQATRELREYFAGQRTRFEVPLAPAGTVFQRAVWRALCEIPFGETGSYEQVASAIGAPRACRAVGAANARNPVPIVVPCHRVIGKRGALTGFLGGIELKRRLLAHEASFAA